MKIDLIFDPDYKMSYEIWRCPECEAIFFAGGKALHKENCSQEGYGGCSIIIGPTIVKKVKEYASEHGDDAQFPKIGYPQLRITLTDIKTQIPEAIE